jgi:hypothetical protein
MNQVDDLDLHAQQLAGGISQQPAHLRFPGQVQDAENVDFSVADGIRKRPGTSFEFRVTGLVAGLQYRLHAIERDADELYLLIYGSARLKLYSTAGTAATINDVSEGGAADTYVDLNTAPGDDLRILSIADTTIIANTTVAMGTKNTATYTVTSEWPTYSQMRSNTPAPQTYHRVTGDEPDFPAGYYFYDPSPDIAGDVTFAVATFNTVSGATWASPTGNWDNAGAYGVKIRFQRRNISSTAGWSWNNGTKRLSKAASAVFRTECRRWVEGSVPAIEVDAEYGCPAGKRLHGRRFPLAAAIARPPVPCDDCTGQWDGSEHGPVPWCECHISPVFEGE